MKIILIYLTAMNILAFGLMGIDKAKARKGAWRIPEKTLFFSAILGGSIGAWLGMYAFRHKTKHWYFVAGIPLILAIQIGIIFCFTGCGATGSATDKGTEATSQDAQSKKEAQQSANSDAQEQEKPKELTLIMVGDILLHDRVEAAAKQEDDCYNYDALFANTKALIGEADLALVNQEVIIGGEEIGVGGYPAFNAPYEMADALVDAGFDVICHGTNHALDRGGAGIRNCIANWRENYPDMGVLGIHDSQESADNIYIVEKNGMRIAILNYTYGTNGIALPSDMPYAVDYLSEDRVIADIERAETEADFTIVCPHWEQSIIWEQIPCNKNGQTSLPTTELTWFLARIHMSSAP